MAERGQLDSAYWSLRVGYGLVPLLAGADKFTNLLCDWDDYLSPQARKVLPVKGRTFMKLVGVVEMAVGAAVLSKWTRFGAYAAAGWLTAIAANLAFDRRYDIAVRDVSMALGAFTLAKLHEAGVKGERSLTFGRGRIAGGLPRAGAAYPSVPAEMPVVH